MTDLKPGRELDALIAERVMGYKRAHMDDPEINFAGDIWLNPNGTKYLHTAALPEYSTSIEAAWEVVEKLHELGFFFDLHWDLNTSVWTTSFKKSSDISEPNFYSKEREAPHAICKAALKAVEGG